jgi:hypothetical protein
VENDPRRDAKRPGDPTSPPETPPPPQQQLLPSRRRGSAAVRPATTGFTSGGVRRALALCAASLVVAAGALWAALAISRLSAELQSARDQLEAMELHLSAAQEQCRLQQPQMGPGVEPAGPLPRDRCVVS